MGGCDCIGSFGVMLEVFIVSLTMYCVAVSIERLFLLGVVLYYLVDLLFVDVGVVLFEFIFGLLWFLGFWVVYLCVFVSFWCSSHGLEVDCKWFYLSELGFFC